MDSLLIPNGLNGATGDYLLDPQSPRQITAVARQEQKEDIKKLEAVRGLQEGVDPKQLAQAGWGVIFAYAERDRLDEIKEALAPLLTLRQEQAGERYREYAGLDAFRPGQSAQDFRARFGLGYGPVNPSKMPYYLLIVADPRALPFEVQYQLAVQHAVGRICFDSLDAYNSYAQSVVAAETGRIARPKQATFFGVHNPDDRATELSATQLIQPLSAWVEQDQPKWQIQTIPPASAQKAQLIRHLGGDRTAALFFGASHGIGFPLGDSRQRPHQGALVCQDWPGEANWQAPIPQDFYLAGDDIGDDAQVAGMIAYFYACYGAGMPQEDYFGSTGNGPVQIAEYPFLAQLPQRLLAHPRGGALAVVGHVERTWSTSFLWDGKPQLETFQSTLKRLMEGHPLGSAHEYFGLRHAELASVLSQKLELARIDRLYKMFADDYHYAVAPLWTAHHDARSYIIIGDPAVRLAVSDTASALKAQPAIIVQTPVAFSTPVDAGSAAVAPVHPQSSPRFQSDVLKGESRLTITTYVVDSIVGETSRSEAARTVISADGTIETIVAVDHAQNWPLLTLHGDTIRGAAAQGWAVNIALPDAMSVLRDGASR